MTYALSVMRPDTAGRPVFPEIVFMDLSNRVRRPGLL
jgi:hypothetical protein